MKFSTRGRYGLRALLDLAVYSQGQYVPLFQIAERQNISANYLEQLFSVLKKAGLVKSIKGSQGGYVLAKSAGGISVGDILRVLEGEISVIDMSSETSDSPLNTLVHSIKDNVWDPLNTHLNGFLDSLTLEHLAEDCKRLTLSSADMYYI